MTHSRGGDPLDRFLDSVDLDVDIENLKLDKRQVAQIASVRRLMRHQQEIIMATLEDLQTAVAETGASATAASDRVIAAIAAAKAEAAAQIADLQSQVQALIDGNAADVTPEALQGVLDSVNAVDATVDAIAPDIAPTA